MCACVCVFWGGGSEEGMRSFCLPARPVSQLQGGIPDAGACDSKEVYILLQNYSAQETGQPTKQLASLSLSLSHAAYAV